MKKENKSKHDKKCEYKCSSIGGQALLEGVMMRGKSSVAICCRDEGGNTVLYTERLSTKKKWYAKVPIIRGIVAFGSSLVGGIKYISKSADVFAGDDENAKLGLFGMVVAVLLAFIFAIGLFIFLPTLFSYLLLDLAINLSAKVSPSIYILIMSLFKGVVKVIVLILYLYFVSKLKDIRRTYMYHGAEHRTINCYEHNLELTVENVQSCSTRHARCGTTFLFYTVMISIIILMLVTWVLSLFGLTTDYMQTLVGEQFGKILYNLICMGVGLVCLPLIAGVSYELLKAIAKAPDNKFFYIFKAPGYALQALTTKKPDDSMAEVAIIAFKKVMEMDADTTIKAVDFYEMSMADARKLLEEKYAKAGIEDSSEVDWLLCHVLGCKRTELRTVERLNKEQGKKLLKLSNERVKGKPLDYVTGKSDFMGFELNVDSRVHLPRMETEITAERAIKLIKDNGYKTALDLMTGSGCIARAISELTDAEVTASDKSTDALEVAKINLSEKVELIESDVFENINKKFDIIISNPPYIVTDVIKTLQKEVQCQPHMSLDGGADGLNFYRIIAEKASDYINDGGALVLEIGYDQGESVSQLLSGSGKYKNIEIIKDFGQQDRVIVAYKK